MTSIPPYTPYARSVSPLQSKSERKHPRDEGPEAEVSPTKILAVVSPYFTPPSTPPSPSKNSAFIHAPSSPFKKKLSVSILSVPPAPVALRNPEEIARVDAFKTILSSLEKGELGRGDEVLEVSAIAKGKGNFCQAYHIVGKPNVIVKAFHDTCIKKYPKNLDSYLRSSYGQYRLLKERNFPVVEIFNNIMADRYYLEEFVPGMINKAAWEHGRSIDDLGPSILALLTQIKKIFARAWQEKIHLDLNAGNLRVRDNGEVVLIDFREDIDDSDLIIDMKCDLQEWAGGNPNIYEFLNPGLL